MSDQQIRAGIRLARKHKASGQLADCVFETDQRRYFHIPIRQLEYRVVLARFEIARHLVANNSRKQGNGVPPRNIFAKRDEMQLSINLDLLTSIGNKQRGVIHITVFFVDRAQKDVALGRCRKIHHELITFPV